MENQIFFIIIGSNQWIISENIRYLNNLVIPEGMDAEYMVVSDKESFPQVLERGMQESSAKYKIYLDQNAFIIDKNFLIKAIQVFNTCSDIGMLGVCGYYKSDNQNEMEVKGHYIYMGNDTVTAYVKEIGTETEKGILDVVALDKHFMMTSLDTEWHGNNNNFNIMKSVELRHMGYRTVILTDEKPLVLFDNGILSE